ncbi:crotonobetaine/carnitine-CoA ligase [Amycolatopsis marina]|uniref:Crotonobetaine/carnitine-CoA ligase n=1 Tax=Amycolatopsis marina TaxID=490629 RepID=A0A1I1ARP7_9PSEU|nr:AMP-binding protein [Amycolatopsis marina]SFB40735.1 crotonobetaine/carnitine-CoA ligase [Amycolatopsis marina]
MDSMTWIQRNDLLPHILRRRAEESPDRVYLRHVDGTSLTYRESYEASLLWANALRGVGVTAGENVLSLLPNSPDSYHIWVGLSWLGAVEVSLSPDYRGRMLSYTIGTADAKLLIVPAHLLGRVGEVTDELPSLRTIIVVGSDDVSLPTLPQRLIRSADLCSGVAPSLPAGVHEPAPWDVCCMIWTSGTTGPSKGVLVPWAEMYSFCHVLSGVVENGDKTYHFLPPHHNSGKVLYYGAVLHDIPMVMRETFSVSRFWSDVRDYEVSHAVLFEPMLRMLLNAAPQADDVDNSLRRIGTAPVSDHLPDFLRRFGLEGANTFYGMTEVGLPFASDGIDLANLDSCGALRDDFYEVRVVDDHDYPVAPGQVGELIIRSHHPWIMNVGYYGMADRTAGAWLNGWFHTGDAFRVDEAGNYYFVDRLKDAIRRRGENISSFEVEAYVNEHPDVAATAAVAAPSELGEDEVKVVVVRVDGSKLTPAQLVNWLIPRMPRFMLPRFVEFVDDLPRTEATFRTRKVELRERGNSSYTWDSEAAGVVVPR